MKMNCKDPPPHAWRTWERKKEKMRVTKPKLDDMALSYLFTAAIWTCAVPVFFVFEGAGVEPRRKGSSLTQTRTVRSKKAGKRDSNPWVVVLVYDYHPELPE
jgi:hypothetical protein